MALDLLLGLEALRPSFPELEHFSLLLRELHDEAALAVVLHTRGLVSHICGLRLKDLKHRYVGVLASSRVSGVIAWTASTAEHR